jgi:MFS transporter, DHA3 family, macrolide efflux protein
MTDKKKLINFQIIGLGEFISVFGSAMTEFALGIWIWKTTGMATPLSIIAVAFTIPNLLFGPIAGVLVDRWPKKWSLLFPNIASTILMGILLLLFQTNHMRVEFLYLVSFLSGLVNTFQFPALSSLVTTMLPKEQYNKGNGILTLIESGPTILAPMLAGILISFMGIPGILTIDVISFVVIIIVLLFIQIPGLKKPVSESYSPKVLLLEAKQGFEFIWLRKSLFYLLSMFFFLNFFGGFSNILFTPYLLAKTNNNSVYTGIFNSTLGIGTVLAGIFMYIWAGPKKRVKGLLTFLSIATIATLFMPFSRNISTFCFFAFMISFGNSIGNMFSQSIWQSKVPLYLQGRVFSARKMIAQISGPISMGLSGPMVDYVMNPIFSKHPILPYWLGTGKANALAITIFFSSLFCVVTMITAILSRRIRNVEIEIPDEN